MAPCSPSAAIAIAAAMPSGSVDRVAKHEALLERGRIEGASLPS
jgi:hypothetical protein